MEIFHPGGQERDFLHFFFGNVAGADRAAAIGEEDVKVASVITDIQDRGVLRYIFLSYYCDFGSCDPQDKSKYSLNDLISLVIGENLPMIHSTSKIGIDRIRYPMTTIQTRIKRIICESFPDQSLRD